MSRPVRVLLGLGLVLALLTGCSGGSDDVGTASAGDTAAEGASGGGGTVGGAPVAQQAVAPAQVVRADRSLIRTAELRVRVDDVRAAADRTGALVRGAGGAVSAEDRGGDGERATADLTLLVPPTRLDAVLDQVARLGDEQDRRLSTEDVTEQVVDLDSRLATQRASVARVRALLDRATGIGDVVKIEGELAKREAELESLQARLRSVSSRVELATLSVHLEGGAAPTAVTATGFREGLDAGWSAFLTSARVLAAAAGALLPFLPLLLVAALVARRLRVRRTPTV